MSNLIQNIIIQQKLQQDVWNYLKEVLTAKNVMEKIITIDEKRHIILGVIENDFTITGYLPLEYMHEENDLISGLFKKDIRNYSEEVKQVLVVNDIHNFKILILTTYKLSSYPNFDIKKLSFPGFTFGYVNDYPNLEKRNFSIRIDHEILS